MSYPLAVTAAATNPFREALLDGLAWYAVFVLVAVSALIGIAYRQSRKSD